MRHLLLAGALAPMLASAQGNPNPVDVKAVTAEIDQLWPTRDQGDAPKQIAEKVDALLKAAPDDYDVLWRAARWHVWVADGMPDGDDKEHKARVAWDLADKAVAKNPARAEGWYYAAASVGLYAQAISIVAALFRGMEGKFLDRLNKAIELGPDLVFGAPATTMGRYFYELPWPKYDGDKSIEWLSKTLVKYPQNSRTHFYLSQTLLKEGKPKEAMDELNKCFAITPGTLDGPDERRTLVRAQAFKPKLEKALR
jgi:tetratricopeptide (TPR) repeat protein